MPNFHQPPQADLRGSEASSVSSRLSGTSDGRRDLGRLFFVILSLTGRRGLADFWRFWPRGQLRGDTLHPKAVLDISLIHDLYFLTMVEGANGRKNAHSASAAEKQFLIT